MRVQSGYLSPRMSGLMLVFGMATALATTAVAQMPPAATTDASHRQPSPPIYDPLRDPMFLEWYPGYESPFIPGGPMTSFPLPGTRFPPTAAYPYPPGYVVGHYAALPFKNRSPNAPRDKGVIDVFLPTANAEVFLNGQKMRGTGPTRRFTTPVLPLSKEYRYWVTASYPANGEMVYKYRKVDVGGGEYAVADFTRPALKNPYHLRLRTGPVDQNETVLPKPE